VSANQLRRVLFFRDFRRFSGGHLKVWDYFNHVREMPGYVAEIQFSEETVWDSSNPWLPLRESISRTEKTAPADMLFLAGMDWERLSLSEREHSHRPIINLIQHVRHADPTHALHAFLHHKAIRICVSEEVRQALSKTGKVNGPLFTIPNGLDFSLLPKLAPEPQHDLLIAGLKQPELARDLAAQFSSSSVPKRGWFTELFSPSTRRSKTGSLRVKTLTTEKPRTEFLQLLSQSRVALFLPTPTEGFYLPALEAMAVGAITVCPDVIGNRSFCLPGINCYRPAYEPRAILRAAHDALSLPLAQRFSLQAEARKTAARHDIREERRKFQELLGNLNQLW
jgi:glycosyltransferase involved in cell wall biosynthesis